MSFAKRVVTAVTIKQVNKALKEKGIDAELFKGPGYFYFDGPSINLAKSSSVMVPRLNDLPLEQWVEEARLLVNASVVEARPSDILYHITGLTSLINIVKTNRFELKPTDGTDAETKLGIGYYLSTARTPDNRYFRNSAYAYSAVLVLDGRKLGQKYKAKPVDYWNSGPEAKEAEDRIWSNGPFIGNAKSYIKEIWLVADNSSKVFNAYRAARLARINVKFVENAKELLKGRPKFVETPKDWVIERAQKPDGPTYDMRRYEWGNPKEKSALRGYLVLYKAKTGIKLPPHADDALRRLKYGGQSLDTEMHNAKGERYGQTTPNREALDELTKVLRKHKWTTKQFEQHLKDKWL